MSLELETVGQKTLATANTVVRRSGLFSSLFGGKKKPTAATIDPEHTYRIPPPHAVGEVIELDIRSIRSRQAFVEGRMVGGQFKVHGQYSEEINPQYGGASIPEVYWVDWVEGEQPFWALLDGNHRTVDAWSRGMTRVKVKVGDNPPHKARNALWAEKPYIPFGDTQLWEGEDYVGKLGEKYVLRKEADGSLGERLASFAGTLRTKLEGQSTSEVAPGFEGVLRRSSGTGLPQTVQSQMEGWLGADFSGVKVHRDEAAHQAAVAINAKAFTIGKDVYFRRGAYDPGSAQGMALLGHELTHVAQNTGGAKTVQRQDDDLTRDSWWARHTVGAYTIGRGLLSFYFGGGLEGMVDVPPEVVEETFSALKGRKGVGPTDLFLAARGITSSDEDALEAALGVALHHSHDLPYLPLKGIDASAPMYDKYKHFFSCAVLSYRGNATGAEWVGWLKEQSDKHLGGGQYDPLDVVANDLGANWASDLLKGKLTRVTEPTKPQRKGLIIGDQDQYEQQADANAEAILQAVRSGQMKQGAVNTATQGLLAAMGGNLRVSRHQAATATRDILRRAIAADTSGGTAVRLQQFADVINAGGGVGTLRRKADVRRSAADSNEAGDAAIEAEVLREEDVPTGDAALSRWPFLRGIVDFFRGAFSGLSATVSDLLVSLLPVIGNVYSVCCGLIGKQIIGWQPLGLLSRILSFAGLVPIPGAGLARKVGGFAQRILGRGRWVRRATSFLAAQFNRYAPMVISTVRGLWSRVLGFAGRITGMATRFVVEHTQKVWYGIGGRFSKSLAARSQAGKLDQLRQSFGQLFTSKLDELAEITGESRDALLARAVTEAKADMNDMLAQGLSGRRFNMDTASEALGAGFSAEQRTGHRLVAQTTREYNETLGMEAVELGSGFRANFSRGMQGQAYNLTEGVTSQGLAHYGQLPWIAGGGAALADDTAIYSLQAGGTFASTLNQAVAMIGHANSIAVHEFGHVMQYAFFQKVFQKLGVRMDISEMRQLQTYLEHAQKPAMESMAYLFGSPVGNTNRQRLVRSFMDTAGDNMLRGNFTGRWGMGLSAMEYARSAMWGALGSGLLGVVVDTICNNIMAGGAVGAGDGGLAIGAGAVTMGLTGAVLGLVKAFGVLRKAKPGDRDPLGEYMGAFRAHRGMSRNLAKAVQELDKPGFGLEMSVRNRLEPFLGEGLSGVRMHTGLAAERLSESINADAFTFGSHVFMGAGQSLDSPEGLGLLAHEATHVVQHEQGRVSGPDTPGRTQGLEVEAYAQERSFVAHALSPGTSAAERAPAQVLREAPPTSEDIPNTLPVQTQTKVLRADANRKRARADIVEQVMLDCQVTGLSRGEFLEELRERLIDLIHDEAEYDNERRETLAWNYNLPQA